MKEKLFMWRDSDMIKYSFHILSVVLLMMILIIGVTQQ